MNGAGGRGWGWREEVRFGARKEVDMSRGWMAFVYVGACVCVCTCVCVCACVYVHVQLKHSGMQR